MTRVAVGTDAALRGLLVFSPPLASGVTMSGAWADNSTLIVTFGNVSMPSTPFAAADTAVGTWVVSVLPSGNLYSAVGQSAPSNASLVVRLGSW